MTSTRFLRDRTSRSRRSATWSSPFANDVFGGVARKWRRVQSPVSFLVDFKHGKLMVRIYLYPEDALEAAGLSE